MLDRVTIRNSRGQELALILSDISQGYIVQDIDGLGPVKATLVTSPFAQIDGAEFQSSRLEPRNVVISLELNPQMSSQSVGGLRSNLYNYVMPKAPVSLKFHTTELGWVQIDGVVESVEPDIFTKDPTVNISVHCVKPNFYNPTSVDVPLNSSATYQSVDYIGTAETGVIYSINVNRTLTQLQIRTFSPVETILTINDEFLPGDVITVSTVPGNKYIHRNRAGVDSSILYAVTSTSVWHKLWPGNNRVRLNIQPAGASIPYVITYQELYGGL